MGAKLTQTVPREQDPQVCGLFEDILSSGVAIRIKATGGSMAPFLRGDEVLTIKKVPRSAIGRGDLIFFKDRDGSLILHRVIRKRKLSSGRNTFRTKGDALISLDKPVEHNRILGKVLKVERNGPTARSKCLNMESRTWQMLNYFAAMVNLAKSTIRHVF